jgi:hypothetical protein
MNFLERQPDNLKSLGTIAPTLLAFKSFCGLPTDESWTESDALLSSLLSSAERLVDELSGRAHRVRSFTYTFDSFQRFVKTGNRYRPIDWQHRFWGTSNVFYGLKIPTWPIAATPLPSITWLDDNASTGTYVSGTDFSTFGLNTPTPEIIFPYQFVVPSTGSVPYPYVLSFNAGGGIDSDVSQICIFELASAYYKKPEMQQEKEPFVSAVFQANLDHLKNSFLG